MQHVEHVSLSNQVLREIRSAIVLGDLAPGARLTFRDVAQRLKASVTPVREALLQLVAERVLSVGPGRTITVPLLTRAQFLELRVIRVVLEGMAAEAAARQAEPRLADELESIHRQLDEAKMARNARQATIQNRAFHFRLYEAAALPALCGMIENIWLRTGPYHRYIFADPSKHIFDNPSRKRGAQQHAHRRVIAGLRVGRPADVRLAIETDILSGDPIILPQLPEDTPDRVRELERSLPDLEMLSRALSDGKTSSPPQKETGHPKGRPASRRKLLSTAAERRQP
ncbi:GntR family transcriptional regulator [Reyranella sp.]|uniref:GntR family transcriptional regulator n=1 Tax=Reyranella sp. TaxID=1929291 RepID=UPI00121B0CC9|nr:FCD domain-containing protein [Reyranella sp.]TAJ89555.1 MAG: FCD domain-containing protein [Reyranella sp.]